MREEISASVDRKKASKLEPLLKTKRKPLKVVYISNPVKVETSASHFRALVQQLTGRDSAPPTIPEPSSLHQQAIMTTEDDVREEDNVAVLPTRVESGNEMGNGSDLSFQDDDNVFMPLLLLDNFNSSFWFESTHV